MRLDNRPCQTNDDCLAGYACFDGVCATSGSDTMGDDLPTLPPDDGNDVPTLPPDDGPPGFIDTLTLGATFVVDAGANVVNFPVQVVIDSGHLDATKLAPNAANLRFVDVDAHALIAYELLDYQPSGNTVVWLQFPTLAPSKTVQIGYAPSGTEAPTDNGWADIAMHGVWHFQQGSSHESSGQAGDFDQNLSASTNNYFAPAAGQTLSAERTVTASLTIELLARPDVGSWSQKLDLAISPQTPVKDFQVPFSANDGPYRVFNPSDGGAVQNTWTETLDDGSHTVWTHVVKAASAALVAYSGPATPITEAGYQTVLDSGLLVSRWDGVIITTTSKADFDALFGSSAYTSANFHGSATVIDCPDTVCVTPGPGSKNFAFLFEGWLLQPKGSYVLGTGSDDGSDILLGGTDWKTDGTMVVSDYGEHPKPDPPVVSAALSGNGLLTRFVYRYNQLQANIDYHAVMGPSAPTYSDVIPTSSYFQRKRNKAGADPVASVSATTYLGSVLHYGSDVDIHVAAADVRATIGSITLTAGGVSGWSAIAVTVNGMNASLFVNGTKRDSGTLTAPITASTVTVGDLSNDALSLAPAIDEIRFSSVARNDAWLSAQARGATVTFQ